MLVPTVLIALLGALIADGALAEGADCQGILERAYADADRRELVWERCHDTGGTTLPYLDSPSGSPVGPEPAATPSTSHFEVVDLPDLECAVSVWAGGQPEEAAEPSVQFPVFDCMADGKVVPCPPRPPVPLVRPEPSYPDAAAERGIEGWVDVRAEVRPDGLMANPVVLNSAPAGVFDAAALAAFSRWQYTETVHEGASLTTRICFRIGKASPAE